MNWTNSCQIRRFNQDKIFLVLYSNEELQRLKNKIRTLVIDKKIPCFICIDEAHNLVTNDTIEIKNSQNEKFEKIQEYMEKNKDMLIPVSELKRIVKCSNYNMKNIIGEKEKGLDKIIEYIREKEENEPDHTYICKSVLGQLMIVDEEEKETEDQKTNKEERYDDIKEYMMQLPDNFKIPIRDIVNRIGRFYYKKKKTKKELLKEMIKYVSNIPEGIKHVSRVEIENIIEQERSDKRYQAVENFLNSFLPNNQRTLLVMSGTPMCHNRKDNSVIKFSYRKDEE